MMNNAKNFPCEIIFNPKSTKYHEDIRIFQGCPTIAVTNGGRIFLGWYAGGRCEPNMENYNLLIYSDDGGKSWSKPVLVIPSSYEMNVHALDIQLFISPDGALHIQWVQNNTSLFKGEEPEYKPGQPMVAGQYGPRGMSFRYDGHNATQDHIVYFDNMSIIRNIDYSEFLAAAYDEFNIRFMTENNLNAITDDLVIPEIDVFETNIECTSMNTSIIANDGTVTQPEVDTYVDFNVRFYSRWGGERTKTYKLHVKADGTSSDGGSGSRDDALDVLDAIDEVETYFKANNTLSNVTANLKLLTGTSNDCTVSWVSGNQSAVTNAGVIKRGTSDVNTTFSFIVSKGDVTSEIQTYNITIAKKTETLTGGGGGGGGGAATSSRPANSGGGGGTTIPVPGAEETPTPTEPTESTKSGFIDVPDTHWASEAVGELAKRGVINGIDDEGNFAPESTVTREQFIKMLLLAAGVEAPETSESIFSDVDETEWYAPYVLAAYELGITTGMGDNKFGVGMAISRQDMCTMTAKLLEHIDTTGKEIKEFGDSESVADYAKAAVELLSMLGIINGDDDGNVNPTSTATRAETAQMLYNALGYWD